MNGIMYLRKSREDEQREKNTGEDTLQIHRERLTALCQHRNINFTERAEVVSGDSISGRPWFTHILDVDIPSELYDCIVVTEISRLGRGDMEDAGRIYKTLINYNIKIVTPNRTYDPTNSSDLRQLRFELFLSREEYEGIKERLWNNRNYKATQGYAGNNIVTLGFRQHRGNVEIIPEEANL
ncbi:MAG TPA: recombinase family protein, partial [Desulfosporosinus sp.]|nr:recombinase family protein [Desulfosporosinus sp.]